MGLQGAREKVTKKRLAEDQEAVDGGTADAWQALVVDLRKGEGGKHTRAFCPEHGEDTLDLRTTAFGQCVMVSLHPSQVQSHSHLR